MADGREGNTCIAVTQRGSGTFVCKVIDLLTRNTFFPIMMFKLVWLFHFCNRGMLGENELLKKKKKQTYILQEYANSVRQDIPWSFCITSTKHSHSTVLATYHKFSNVCGSNS